MEWMPSGGGIHSISSQWQSTTGDHEAVIPIMAVSMLGYLTSRILSREPLYHGLSRVFIAAAIRI